MRSAAALKPPETMPSTAFRKTFDYAAPFFALSGGLSWLTVTPIPPGVFRVLWLLGLRWFPGCWCWLVASRSVVCGVGFLVFLVCVLLVFRGVCGGVWWCFVVVKPGLWCVSRAWLRWCAVDVGLCGLGQDGVAFGVWCVPSEPPGAAPQDAVAGEGRLVGECEFESACRADDGGFVDHGDLVVGCLA